MRGEIDLVRVARRIDERFPALSARGALVALGVHRALAMGQPVPDYAVAAIAGLRISEVQDEMQGWPGVYRNEAGRVVGFWGLGLHETEHRFTVDGRDLHTWCAWDALFLPELLGKEARVSSTCAASDQPIELIVAPHGIVRASGPDIALTFLDPERADVEGDRVISTFCHHILFFSTRALAEEWARARENGVFVLGLDEGFELGRLCNALRYGAALGEAPSSREASASTGA